MKIELSASQKKQKREMIKYFLNKTGFANMSEAKAHLKNIRASKTETKKFAGCSPYIAGGNVCFSYNDNPHFYLGKCWLLSCHDMVLGHADYII